MPTRQQTVRMPDGLEQAVRSRHPELADEPLALLIRAGLAVLAGWSLTEAVNGLRGRARYDGRIRLPDKPPDGGNPE
jgi:hypothetical protein